MTTDLNSSTVVASARSGPQRLTAVERGDGEEPRAGGDQDGVQMAQGDRQQVFAPRQLAKGKADPGHQPALPAATVVPPAPRLR